MIDTDAIEAALSPDVSNVALAQRFGCSAEYVRVLRKQAGVADYPRGRQNAHRSWADAVAAHSRPVGGGHVRWTGPVSANGTPVVRFAGGTQTVYRVMFRLHYRRDPDGAVTRVCEERGCVAGPHLEDRELREARRRQGAARATRPVRLDPPPGATWYRGVDLLAVERVVDGTPPLPRLNEAERRHAVVVMTEAGHSAETIAERLRTEARIVRRWQAEAGLSESRQEPDQ